MSILSQLQISFFTNCQTTIWQTLTSPMEADVVMAIGLLMPLMLEMFYPTNVRLELVYLGDPASFLF